MDPQKTTGLKITVFQGNTISGFILFLFLNAIKLWPDPEFSTRKINILSVLFRRFFIVSAIERNCILPLKPDWSFFSPLIFSLDGKLISTESVSDEAEDITLAVGDEVLLSCAPNYFREFSSEKVLRAKCKKDKTLGWLMIEIFFHRLFTNCSTFFSRRRSR